MAKSIRRTTASPVGVSRISAGVTAAGVTPAGVGVCAGCVAQLSASYTKSSETPMSSCWKNLVRVRARVRV